MGLLHLDIHGVRIFGMVGALHLISAVLRGHSNSIGFPTKRSLMKGYRVHIELLKMVSVTWTMEFS